MKVRSSLLDIVFGVAYVVGCNLAVFFCRVGVICFVVVIVVHPVYIMFVVSIVAVGAVHRSHVVSRREVVGIRKDVIIVICWYVGWGRGIFCLCVSIVTTVPVFNLYFR